MKEERPSIRFAAPSSEERTVIDATPWHQEPELPDVPVTLEPPEPAGPPEPPEAPEPPPSVPVLVTDALPPPPPSGPRLRSDWAAIGATAIFVMLSAFMVHTMSTAYAHPAAAAPLATREVRVKGFVPAHDPALREVDAKVERRR